MSVQHAVFRWHGGVWTLRDLASRNGTFVNGQRVVAGPTESFPLNRGDEIAFAESDEVWEFFDDAAPGTLLIPIDADGEVRRDATPYRLDAADVVAIPSAQEPTASAYQRSGRWYLERSDAMLELDHGQRVRVAGERYVVHLSSPATGTVDAEHVLVDHVVKNARLIIGVSPDEESAAVTVHIGRDEHELERRTFLYLLAYLARVRLDDVSDGRDEHDAGWVEVHEACRNLQLSSSEALGLLVHRCRKAMQEARLDDPASVIDRSRRGLLRIGVPSGNLEIRSA